MTRKLFSALAILALSAGPASAAIKWCPLSQVWYDDVTGNVVDGPNATPAQPVRRSPLEGMEFDYQGYNDYLGY